MILSSQSLSYVRSPLKAATLIRSILDEHPPFREMLISRNNYFESQPCYGRTCVCGNQQNHHWSLSTLRWDDESESSVPGPLLLANPADIYNVSSLWSSNRCSRRWRSNADSRTFPVAEYPLEICGTLPVAHLFSHDTLI